MTERESDAGIDYGLDYLINWPIAPKGLRCPTT